MDEVQNNEQKTCWSYSRTACFGHCKYEFYLDYIINDDKQYLSEGNYYAEVGSYVHEILSMIFSGKLKVEDALGYYIDHYDDYVCYKVRKSTMDKTFELIADYFASLDIDWLKEKLTNRSQSIKQVLLDQKIICGIGNIYASEALYLAGILPTRLASSLSRAECQKLLQGIRKTLSSAIEAGGSTLKDYRKPDGSLGYFQNSHCVYNKTGQTCLNCICNIKETGGIKKIVQNGRSTYFCETKQR